MEEQIIGTRFYPIDAERMTKGTELRALLEAGNQVVLGNNAWIIDIWNPITKKLYDHKGIEIGTRETPFKLPEATEVRTTSYETIKADKIDEYGEGSDTWEALARGFEVTFDGKGWICDIWDPVTKKVMNLFGDEIGTRNVSYSEYREREYRNPLIGTYDPKDKTHFAEGSDAYEALNAGRQVTLDEYGYIIDIWDETTGIRYDIHGYTIGHRKDPYPSDNNIATVKAKYEALFRQIGQLRIALRKAKGSAKAAFRTRISANLIEYGQAVWLYGRLKNKRRWLKKRYDQKRTRSKTIQQPKD